MWNDLYNELGYMYDHDILAISNYVYRDCIRDILEIMDTINYYGGLNHGQDNE